MKVIIVLNDHRISVYTNEDQGIRQLTIRGETEYDYKPEKMKEMLEFLQKAIASTLNCNGANIQYSYLGEISTAERELISNILQGEEIKYEDYIAHVYAYIEQQGKLIEEHGINVHGLNYRKREGRLIKTLYDLLGYTLSPQEFLACIRKER